MPPAERHRTHRIAWLRAAVLGANDGLISTSGLIVGVASASSSSQAIFVAAVAGMVAGAISMAAGEYVSVSSQADTEKADLALERAELVSSPESELAELAGIYVGRGLSSELAHEVAVQLTAHDALGAHARDELGHSNHTRARPFQAAWASAAAFAVGAIFPTALTLILPADVIIKGIAASTLILLVFLGALAAQLGGAARWRGALRVTFWGAIAMITTSLVGRLFGSPG